MSIKLNFFGHGHFVLYSIQNCLQYQQSKTDKSPNQHDKWRAAKLVFLLILLAGDIQLNPGPPVIQQPTDNNYITLEHKPPAGVTGAPVGA